MGGEQHLLGLGIGLIVFGVAVVALHLHADQSRRRWAAVRGLMFCEAGVALVVGRWSKVAGGLILLLALATAIVVITVALLQRRDRKDPSH